MRSILSARSGVIGSPWVIVALSVLAFGVLAVLLWSPWDRPAIASGKTLRFYCAAGLTRPVAEIVRSYQEAYGVQVEPSYDGSGSLISTIESVGGAGDLYLSGDEFFMRKAQEKGLVAETIPVAILRPVLVVNRRTQKELTEKGRPVTGLRDLLRDDLQVVLADPERTAVGILVRDKLKALDLWTPLSERLKSLSPQVSTVPTVNAAAQTVATRDKFIGVVWSAVAEQFPDLETVPVPEFEDRVEHVMIGVLARSENPTAALQFARYLTGRNTGAEVFRKHHFEPIPDADIFEERPEIHVAAGAMLEPAIKDVIKAFQEREGVRINTSYNGCGILVSQMESMKRDDNPGKFPDAYVSCDLSFMRQVQQWFEAATIILENDMVLIVPKGNPRGIKSLDDLKRPELQVGVPHPKNSAMGKLIDDLLKRLNLHDAVYAPGRQKPVVHSDAAHVLVNQMRTGALDVAVVGRSNAQSNPTNLEKYIDIIEIDAEGALATQTFAVSRESGHKYMMQRLLQAIVASANAERARALGFRFVYEPK